MKDLSLISADHKITGKWGDSNVLFLVWDGGSHKLVTCQASGEHCVAAFCRESSHLVAIKMHNSVSLGGEEQKMWLKNGDALHIGLDAYQVAIKKSRRRAIWIVAASMAVALASTVVFSVLFTRPIHEAIANKTVEEPKIDVQKEWQVNKLLSDARAFMSSGDAQQAKMSVQQVMNLAPENIEARQMLVALQDRTASEVTDNAFKLSLEQAEALMQQADSAYAGGYFKAARDIYLKAKGLFKDKATKPAFYSGIEDGIKNCEAKLIESIEPKLLQAQRSIDTSDAAKIKEAVVSIQDAGTLWPEYPRSKELLAKAYEALNKLAMEHVMKADTLRSLSGCKDAKAQYKMAMNVASFPEVQAYRRAEEGIEQCM